MYLGNSDPFGRNVGYELWKIEMENEMFGMNNKQLDNVKNCIASIW